MKKLLPIALATLALAACGKEHQCKCTTDNDDGLLKVFVVDGSLDCDDIKSMMNESKWTIDGQQLLRRTDTVIFSCRDYKE